MPNPLIYLPPFWEGDSKKLPPPILHTNHMQGQLLATVPAHATERSHYSKDTSDPLPDDKMPLSEG